MASSSMHPDKAATHRKQKHAWGKRTGSPLSAPPCTLFTCKPIKSHFQTHILTQNEHSVILISPQHCLFVRVEKDKLYYVACRGHHPLNYVTVWNECLVDCCQGLSSTPGIFLSLKWSQKYLLFQQVIVSKFTHLIDQPPSVGTGDLCELQVYNVCTTFQGVTQD